VHTDARPKRPAAPAASAAPAGLPGARAGRRAVLIGAAGVLGGASLIGLTGCGILGGEDSPEPTVLDAFLASTAALADRYDATVTANPDLAAALTPLRDAHRAHVAALASAVGRPAPAVGSGEAITGGRAGVYAALAEAEKTARAEAEAECLKSTPRLAGLLGSIAAARATHLEVLT
jgi:hypothetical protein